MTQPSKIVGKTSPKTEERVDFSLDIVCGPIIIRVLHQILQSADPFAMDAIVQKQNALLFALEVEIAADHAAHP